MTKEQLQRVQKDNERIIRDMYPTQRLSKKQIFFRAFALTRCDIASEKMLKKIP